MRSRLLCFALLAALCVFLSGCVYLRLLQLKNQLGAFDRYFKTDTSNGLRIECREPLLLAKDLRWLGGEPKTIESTSNGEKWLIRWVKEPPPGVTEATVYDVELHTHFIEDRLVAVDIPERFFAYFPKELFLNLLRSAGAAKVDKSERRAEANTEAPPATSLPRLEAIKGMLGEPTRQQQRDDGALVYLYRYRPDTPVRDVKPVEMTFVFDATRGHLRKLTSKLPRGTLNFAFAEPVPKDHPADAAK